MKSKLTSLVIFFMVASLGLMIYSLYNSTEVLKSTAILKQSSIISTQSNLVLAEYYRNQLEFWKYADDPSDERLETFRVHERIFADLTTTLKSSVEGYNGVSKQLNKILAKIELIKAPCVEVIKNGQSFIQAQNDKSPQEEINQQVVALKQSLLVAEQTLNDLNLDYEFGVFANDQLTELNKNEEIVIRLTFFNQIILFILAGFYLASLIFSSILINKIIKKIK